MDTVMVVDDDAAIRELYTIYLTMGGFRPLAVPGGTACLDLLKTQTPDLIILDLMMEPMDGWETLVAITGSRLPWHIPVMVITGKQPVREDILEYGGYLWDYILKPVDLEQVVDAIPAVIEKDRELRRQIESAGTRGADPALSDEYVRLLKLVTVAHAMEKRRRKSAWTDPVPIKNQEERLKHLHKILGFPDRPPGPVEGQ